MRYLSILLIFAATISLHGQPWKPLRKVILFENQQLFVILKIAEGQRHDFYLDNGQKVSGVINKICGDTITIGDTAFIAGDITEIRKSTFAGQPWMTPRKRSNIWYRSDASVWKITCPPPEAYQNAWIFHQFLSNRERAMNSARKATYNPFIYKNFLKVNLVKLAHLEIALAYERVIGPKLSLETEIGVIFGVQGADAHYQFNYPLYNYNGFSLTSYPKLFLINPRTYFGFVFMYRYLWFDQVRTGWPEGGGNSSYLQDQVRHDFGGSLRLGFMRRFDQLVIDWYVGGGLKLILLHQDVYGVYTYHDSMTMYWLHENHSPDSYDKVLLGPVINAGIKLGFGF